MGTSLTGVKIKDSYDSLLKVTDNGPLSGTAKYLSDGLGNDSVLALSTTAVGIGTASPSEFVQLSKSQSATTRLQITNPNTGGGTLTRASLRVTANDRIGEIVSINGDSVYFGTGSNHNAIFMANGGSVLTATPAGNVGIGTASPDIFSRFYTRSVGITSSGTTKIQLNGSTYSGIDMGKGGTRYAEINASDASLDISTISAIPIVFYTNSTARMLITSDAYMRMASGTGGIQFNGDSAAANALDDYEEGTWTPTITFGGASVGIVYGANVGKYTKIGNKVTVTGLLALTSKGSSTGEALLLGLPFSIVNSSAAYSKPSLRFTRVTFSDVENSYGVVSGAYIQLQQLNTTSGIVTNLDNTNFIDTSDIIISFTYFTS